MFHFYTPWKRQEKFGMRYESRTGGIEVEHRLKRVKNGACLFREIKKFLNCVLKSAFPEITFI